jgi:molecular chaperone DnaK
MQGEIRDVLLLDVTPLSLGIETLGGVMTKMIEKNTTIPVSKTQIFSTATDNQPSVEIHVLQGERPMAADNKTLGRFILDGIPPAPRGVPQIEVTFDIDVNGILNVKAKDKATGREQSVRIEGSSGLTEEEKKRMMAEAEKFAAEDARKKELAEARNAAESLVYMSEKALKDAGEKISADDKKLIEDKIAAVKNAQGSEDVNVIKKATEELSTAVQKIGQAMYGQSQQSTSNSQQSAGNEKSGEPKEEKK